MALVWADRAFNFDRIDFNGFAQDFVRANGTEIVRATPSTVHGATYATRLDLPLGGTRVTLAGDGLDGGKGTVRVIAGPLTADGSNGGTGLQGLTLSFSAALRAAFTPDLSDDRSLLRAELMGADTFSLSDRADLARGFGGDDTLRGRGGDDRLFGDAGDDKVFGGAGADRLEAGAGRDLLVGGAGRDTLVGGTDGAGDVFVFTARQDSGTGAAADAIANFTSGADDIILREIDARPSTGTNESFLWGGQTAARFSVWWEVSGKGVVLHADLTGDARSDFDLAIGGTTRLSQADVLL